MRPAEGGRGPVAVVIGALAPYTHVLYTHLADALDRPLHVLACSPRESARRWTLDEDRRYRFEVLPGLRWHRSAVTNHYVNPGAVSRLAALKPAVTVLNDFSPTMALAAGFLRWRRLPYGLRTDGVPETDPGRRSPAHRLLRRVLVPGAAFGLGPSAGSEALLTSYGLAGPFGRAPLFPAWQAENRPAAADRPYDVLFCGALNEEVKGARFFTDVVLGCAAAGIHLRVRVVGEGPLRAEMEARLTGAGIAARFDGFLQQAALGEAYGSARLFHFPSRGDVWGIVVQEAIQSGAVVIASPHAGAARELVAGRACGTVLPLDRALWIRETIRLLTEPAEMERLREAGMAALEAFTPERAAAAYLSLLEPFLRDAAPPSGPKRTSSV